MIRQFAAGLLIIGLGVSYAAHGSSANSEGNGYRAVPSFQSFDGAETMGSANCLKSSLCRYSVYSVFSQPLIMTASFAMDWQMLIHAFVEQSSYEKGHLTESVIGDYQSQGSDFGGGDVVGNGFIVN